MKFEQEEFAGLKRSKISCGGRPKIDLDQLCLNAKMLEPIAVGDCNNQPNGHQVCPWQKARHDFDRFYEERKGRLRVVDRSVPGRAAEG